MIAAIATLLGAFFNRIRGGFIEWVPAKKFINALVFGLLFGVIGLAVCSSWWTFTYLFIASTAAMYLGSLPGWGAYFGALGGYQKDNLEEVWWIDMWITWLKPWPILWGLAGLTLRGAFWGLLIAIAQVNLWALMGGLLMGVTYFVAFRLCRLFHTKNWQGDGIEVSEWYFGALLWAMCTIGIL